MPDESAASPNASSDVIDVEAWAGELRVNVIRLIGIVVFYSRHLVDFFLASPGDPVRGEYHVRVTWVCVLWAGMAIVVHSWLVRRSIPPWLKYATSLWDVILVTLACAIAGGPRAPLVMLYFVIIAMAPLRLSLRLVYITTAAAVLGYLSLLAHYAWYVIGFNQYYGPTFNRIPRREEAIIVISLLLAGFVAGQCVRQMRRMMDRPDAIAKQEVAS